ncbi:ribonuclease-domain-containing protein [Annulohypoxylon maeteangense]|uniref:ribonuclease-domain-containing protein n=1 Tax=Annulohypoxylon maeteangense TaxID=1927788 RepID=UPI00200840AB|nr:ribonuclease-domain-containing protein [Annulohypoxylon maeteangense]KAI0883340.1 ribonuclease-domain-containing protein [Annulohypoxylon maeteangense]
MFGSKILSTIFLAAISAVQVSAVAVSERQSQTCVATCGSTCYWQSDIDAAVKQGYNYQQQGKTVGSGKYPHVYNDYEGFNFPDSGTYYEFPILSSFKVYTGGSPGADRVVFLGSNGNYEGSITHTGASGNNFVQCS